MVNIKTFKVVGSIIWIIKNCQRLIEQNIRRELRVINIEEKNSGEKSKSGINLEEEETKVGLNISSKTKKSLYRKNYWRNLKKNTNKKEKL